MKLHYLHTTDGTLRVLALTRGPKRTELYIKSVAEQVWALVALSGEHTSQPGLRLRQGPFHSVREAEEAVRTIAADLLEQDYRVESPGQPHWPLPAQRLAREIRDRGAPFTQTGCFDRGPHDPLW
ncbi:MAG: hypothetical protein EA349_00340 [Halomonadaceae bacterium]|nr:MAG: hypothetical protein EA349_00340 [Halomonadaceae bacterium]